MINVIGHIIANRAFLLKRVYVYVVLCSDVLWKSFMFVNMLIYRLQPLSTKNYLTQNFTYEQKPG